MTPHRDFRDDDDHIWTAWDVIPSWGERRGSERRRLDSGAPIHSGERRRTDRRTVRGIRVPLAPVLAKGWLAFES
ncbi:MAG: hypothetical protein ABI625_18205, partial [bacterium]